MNVFEQKGAREYMLRLFLMIAGAFAIGSVGFFLAVLLEHTAATPAVVGEIHPAANQASTASKEQILASLNASSSESESSASSSTSQGSADEAQTAAKLKVLESLNAQ